MVSPHSDDERRRDPFADVADLAPFGKLELSPALAAPQAPVSAAPSHLPKPPDQGAEAEAAPPLTPREFAESAATGRMIWLCILMLSILLFRYAVPFMCEEIARAVTRGRQRAEYEVASQYLQQVSFDSLSKAYQMVSQRVAPSVVHINVDRTVDAEPRDEASFLFGPQRRRKLQDQGSGVVVDAAGLILTNGHVVQDGRQISVTLSDGRVVTAELLGIDPLTDLALLQIRAAKLIAAEWGDSDALQVGALVWAAGSPFGLQSTVTQGILSAKNRAGLAGTPHQDFLQTDAAVNPGNSGGPLVDSHGRVVGINTAIIGESFQGISFAVPSSIARDVYLRLKKNGRVERGFLGVEMAELDEEIQQRLQLRTERGALVISVVANRSPAEQAGVQVGDVIVGWNGADVDNPTALSRLVAQTDIGSSAELTIERSGRELVLRVEVGRRP